MSSKKFLWISLCFLVLILASCTGSYEQEYQFEYNFEEDEQGWVTGFADLPADYDPQFFELDSGWGALLSGLEGNAIYLNGHNHSDDLFMFLKVPEGDPDADIPAGTGFEELPEDWICPVCGAPKTEFTVEE